VNELNSTSPGLLPNHDFHYLLKFPVALLLCFALLWRFVLSCCCPCYLLCFWFLHCCACNIKQSRYTSAQAHTCMSRLVNNNHWVNTVEVWCPVVNWRSRWGSYSGSCLRVQTGPKLNCLIDRHSHRSSSQLVSAPQMIACAVAALSRLNILYPFLSWCHWLKWVSKFYRPSYEDAAAPTATIPSRNRSVLEKRWCPTSRPELFFFGNAQSTLLYKERVWMYKCDNNQNDPGRLATIDGTEKLYQWSDSVSLQMPLHPQTGLKPAKCP